MHALLQHPTSIVHVLSALVALATGTAVLRRRKGTRGHRRLGWLYVGSMGLALGTAFGIYTLFGGFGLVHWGALAAGGLLALGVAAPLGRAWLPDWLRWHYLGLGGSLVGAYAALAAEITYRLLPPAYFWWATLGPAGAVLLLGGGLLHRHYARQAGPPATKETA
ncbi:MAG: hypothetical protein EOO59_16465 [Hymenobacter sp.]|nr:MAG: hypothetical protein EOO59_16465 [Hymenobacter sp.]